METFDYILVGAGSAGCVLANRLTADGKTTVLLLEAGGWDRDPWIHIPLGIGRIFPNRLHDWMYFTDNEETMDGRSIECARGKVIGGSSSVNVMAYVRGHRTDYDRWAGYGLSGWSYQDVLPYFRKAESWQGAPSAYRGSDGPLTVRESAYQDPLLQAFIKAGHSAGYPLAADYNGEQQDGFALIQETIDNGRRASTARAYLRPALRRSNLHVATRTLVERITLENGRATGVVCSGPGGVKNYRARREIILCGGVINSPQLLMLSGIGDGDALKSFGLNVAHHLPGVGKNLQDHISYLARYARRTESPFQKNMRFDRLARSAIAAYLFGKGFASDVPIGVTAFLKSSAELSAPDIQFLFLAAPFPTKPYLRPFVQPMADGFSCRVALLRPQSRGAVTLRSANAKDAPRIKQNFLSTAQDRRTLRNSVAMIRRVASQPALAPFVESEIAPGSTVTSDDDVDAFIRATGVTVHHPIGTCKIGAAEDPMAVVDHQLRVCGISNLRVADASVMPDLVGGNTNAAVIMIAERAADLIARNR